MFNRSDGSAGQSEGQHYTIEASKEPQHAGHSNTYSSATNQGLVA